MKRPSSEPGNRCHPGRSYKVRGQSGTGRLNCRCVCGRGFTVEGYGKLVEEKDKEDVTVVVIGNSVVRYLEES